MRAGKQTLSQLLRSSFTHNFVTRVTARSSRPFVKMAFNTGGGSCATKLLTSTESLLSKYVNRGIHSTSVKRMGGGHAHGHNEPYYLHAKHMYNLDRMKNQKLTMNWKYTVATLEYALGGTKTCTKRAWSCSCERIKQTGKKCGKACFFKIRLKKRSESQRKQRHHHIPL